MQEQREQDQDFENADAARRKLLADESAELLGLVAQLKNEMDKTDKDRLSLGVIRKAEQIEKLAKDVKAQMKLTIGRGQFRFPRDEIVAMIYSCRKVVSLCRRIACDLLSSAAKKTAAAEFWRIGFRSA